MDNITESKEKSNERKHQKFIDNFLQEVEKYSPIKKFCIMGNDFNSLIQTANISKITDKTVVENYSYKDIKGQISRILERLLDEYIK